MHILWVELQRFYAEPTPDPVVIFRDKMVLDCNEAASKRGIDRSLTLQQAKAILPEGNYKAWQGDAYEKRSRAWLDLCVDYTGVIEPFDQHSAWLDLSLHPNPVGVADSLVRVLTQKMGLKIRYGASLSKWLSYLADNHNDCGLAVRDPKAFLAPLPVSELLPIRPEQRERLRFLGYYTIGAVADLSLRTLKEQFDEEALVIHSAANGHLMQRVEPLYPPDSVSDRIIFDGEVDSTEAIDEACKSLAVRVGERLQALSSQSGKLRVTLELEDGTLRPLTRKFTKPLRCQRSVYSALRLLVDPALDQPISSIRVNITDLEKVRLFQSSLIDGNSSKSSPQVEAAMRHVRTVFGDTSVQLGSQIELPRRVKVLKEWKHATGWR